MKELILSEIIYFKGFSTEESDIYTFPKIQTYLDDGYCIKQIFQEYAPKHINGIIVTVHLQKLK